ncbi:MAG: membrane protein [Congregibacter sp.]
MLPSRHAIFLFALTLVLAGCATAPPEDLDNLCAIFREKPEWYKASKQASSTWGVPIPVLMAIVHQESRFQAKAKPPRKKILGFIPGSRPSDSYGYSQALGSTWEAYQRSAGRYGADRDDFDDAVDFVGWYNHQSYQRNNIPRTDAYRLYLAYHEGHGGYSRQTYQSKPWLIDVARKVNTRSARYTSQLNSCQKELDSAKKGWFNWF